MKITVVGCCGAYPEANGATSGYLIEYKNTKVLLDCGSGIIAKLQNYINLEDLDAVVFSHYHRDHCADLECMQYAAMIDTLLGKRKAPLSMWGGKDDHNNSNLTYKEYCIGREYSENEPFSIGELSFIAQANVHEIPSYSIKVRDGEGSCIVYSGDTGYYDLLCDFLEGAHHFLCECSLYSNQKGQVAGHLCSTEAGMIASRANVKNLVLTHFPHYGDRNSLIKEAGEAFTGKIVLAHPGMELRT